MDDVAAYMELVRANAQGELTALERGMHALGFVEKGKHGKSAEAYAKETGREKEVRSVRREIDAAEVVHEIGDIADLSDRFHQLVEIHSSPRWLWPALVARMVADEMTVDATRKLVAGVKDVAEPPGWADAVKIAEAVANERGGDDDCGGISFTHRRAKRVKVAASPPNLI